MVDTGPPPGPGARWTAAGIAKIAMIFVITVPLLPLQALLLRIRPELSRNLPPLYHRVLCRILGVRVKVHGVPPAKGTSALICANHVSWLDIPVISSQTPVSFVAKSEIAGWPGIGLLARLQRTIFIDRTRKAATISVAGAMGERISGGDRVVLFPEGTTGDGSRILPFRSSLFGAVKEAIGGDDREITVQPLTVLYTGRHGLPGGRHERALLAWYGDIDLAPHLREVLNGGPVDVTLVWGEPISMGRAHSRKEAARRAEADVRRAATIHLTGRPRD